MRKTIIACALLLCGCQTWSEVTGSRYGDTDITLRTAVIDQVDNQSVFASNPIKVEPGRHRLVLQAPAPTWRVAAPLKVYVLDAQPCTRYYINSQFQDPFSPDWIPVIDHVETIQDCKLFAAQQ